MCDVAETAVPSNSDSIRALLSCIAVKSPSARAIGWAMVTEEVLVRLTGGSASSPDGLHNSCFSAAFWSPLRRVPVLLLQRGHGVHNRAPPTL